MEVSISFPGDLLVEIFHRSDPITVIRCAAVCKPWRRLVVDNASSLCSRLGRFIDRRFLHGFFYQEDYDKSTLWFCRIPDSSSADWHHRLASSSHEAKVTGPGINRYCRPLASRDGLLLLGCPYDIPTTRETRNLCVCKPMSGGYSFLPHPTVHRWPDTYVLLTSYDVDIPTSSFQILAVGSYTHGLLTHQIFSSESGAWGPVRATDMVVSRSDLGLLPMTMHSKVSVVCRGAVHWLGSDYTEEDDSCFLNYIVALDVDTGHVSLIKLPLQCRVSREEIDFRKSFALATLEDGWLSSLKAEPCLQIFVWVHNNNASHGAANWTMLYSIDSSMLWHSIDSWTLCYSIDGYTLRYSTDMMKPEVAEARLSRRYMPGLLEFCPRSKCVFVQVPGYGLVLLDLKSRQIECISTGTYQDIWPCQIDWASYLSSLKTL